MSVTLMRQGACFHVEVAAWKAMILRTTLDYTILYDTLLYYTPGRERLFQYTYQADYSFPRFSSRPSSSRLSRLISSEEFMNYC